MHEFRRDDYEEAGVSTKGRPAVSVGGGEDDDEARNVAPHTCPRPRPGIPLLPACSPPITLSIKRESMRGM